MSYPNNIFLQVVGIDGQLLIAETHDINFGTEGLLLIPVRLGVAVEQLVCFPSKEKCFDTANMGAHYSAVCAALHPTLAASIANTFENAGFTVLNNSIIEIWVRTNSLGNEFKEPPNCASKTTKTSDSATTSRLHINGEVRNRMKELCNTFCPRRADGIFFAERNQGQGRMKRPAWCIESIMDALNKEFEPSRLVGVRGATIRYMARSSKSFQNLKSLSDYDWAAMTTESKESKLQLLRDYEEEAAVWRQGPYGVLWEQQKSRDGQLQKKFRTW